MERLEQTWIRSDIRADPPRYLVASVSETAETLTEYIMLGFNPSRKCEAVLCMGGPVKEAEGVRRVELYRSKDRNVRVEKRHCEPCGVEHNYIVPEPTVE